METSRFSACLADDYARLREVAVPNLTKPVPSCPEWTVADLVWHVAEVYLHKSACIRLNAAPQPWPPAGLADREPVALLEHAWETLGEDFATRAPDDAAFTWYEPDQTVGFWIRRMAQETVIHRVDAELAAGAPIAPIPDDLAEDGIDELLRCFVEYGSRHWPGAFAETLSTARGRVVQIASTGRAWSVRVGRDEVEVHEPADGGPAPDAVIRGRPHDLLLRLWHRTGDDTVEVSGDPAVLDELRAVTVIATQ